MSNIYLLKLLLRNIVLIRELRVYNLWDISGLIVRLALIYRLIVLDLTTIIFRFGIFKQSLFKFYLIFKKRNSSWTEQNFIK